MDNNLDNVSLKEIRELLKISSNQSDAVVLSAFLQSYKNLQKDEQRSRQTAETLRVASIEMAKDLESDTILEILLDYLGWIVKYERAYVMFMDENNELIPHASRDYGEPKLQRSAMLKRGFGYTMGRCNAEQVTVQTETEHGTILCIPLQNIQERTAVLLIEDINRPCFEEYEVHFAEALASQAQVTIKNARLFLNIAESEKYFRTLIEKSSDIITLFFKDTTLLYMSPQGQAYLREYNIANDQIKFSDLILQEDREIFLESLEKTIDDPDYSETIQFTMQTGDGALHYFEGTIRNMCQDESIGACILNWRDITELRQSSRIREAIVASAESLRSAHSWAEMLSLVLDTVRDFLKAPRVMITLHDEDSGLPKTKLELGIDPLKDVEAESNLEELCNRAHISQRDEDSPNAIAHPLITEHSVIGAIACERSAPFSKTDHVVLKALTDIAASAIRRAVLFEQTETRLRRLSALRTIDTAIAASHELSHTLDIILSEAQNQLRVDACAILLLNRETQLLEYAHSAGFLTNAVRKTRIAIGESFAGKAAETRKMVREQNFLESPGQFIRSPLFLHERFQSYYGLPLIVNDELLGVLEIFNRSVIDRGEEWENYLQTLANQAAIAVDSAELFERLEASNLELLTSYDATIEGWSLALELRDHETEGHAMRVANSALTIAQAMGMNHERLMSIRRGALLHDIGKIGIPDSILLKQGTLTEEERVEIRKHPVYAFKLLGAIPFLRSSIDIPYCHHERWDGLGYPRGLKGEEIPIEARVFTVVDVYDALSHERPYHAPWERAKILEYIENRAGTEFDPHVVNTFLRLCTEGIL